MSQASHVQEPPLSPDLINALAERGVTRHDEISLRLAVEERVPGYNLFRLTPAAARRWKCRYRLMFEAGYVDGQSVAEVYARGLLALPPDHEPASPSSNA